MLGDPRLYTVVALMLANFLTAVDSTIVDTAMPRIVGSLGGFAMLTWLVTAYMLTSTATVPVYGKLCDIIGRKRTFTIGAVIFVLGSALCGLAPSMELLILFRGLQGLGAGAIVPTIQTIVGDIFTPTERVKVQGWFSAVWGFSALVGPLVGGIIVDHASWRWLFYINLPLGAIALVMVWTQLQEKLEPRQVQVDYLGSITLTAGITCLLLVLLNGGTAYPWGSAPVLSLAALSVTLLVIFVWQERRHPDPMLPLGLLRMPSIGLPVLASFMVGGVMYGTTVYLPVWAQGVQGFSATRSGASLLWLSVGWPVASVIGARFVLKLGVRPAAVLGLVCNTAAAAALVVLGRVMHQVPEVALAAVTFMIGAGMGFTTLAFILGVQNSVNWSQRGVATASLQFLRTLGGLVWVSGMGAAMNLALLSRLRTIPGLVAHTTQEAGEIANALLDPKSLGALPPAQVDALRAALAAALQHVHLIVLAAAVLGLGITLFVPNIRFIAQPQAGAPQKVRSTH